MNNSFLFKTEHNIIDYRFLSVAKKRDVCWRGLVNELDDSSSLILELNQFLCDNLLKYDSSYGMTHYSSSHDDCELKKGDCYRDREIHD